MIRSAPVLLLALLAGATQAQSLPSLPPPPPLTASEMGPYLAAAEAADRIEEGEARCLTYPELPRIGWPRDVVVARCAMQRAPRYSAPELVEKLATRAGRAEVSRSLATLLDQHYKVPAQREQIFLAIEPFKNSAALNEPVAAWVAAEPNNPWARLAQGARLKGAAQDSRGTRFIQETGAAELQNARDLAQAAIPHLVRALVIEPRLSPACVVQIEAVRLAGEPYPEALAEHCVSIDPASYHTVVAWYPGVPEAEVLAHLQKHGSKNALLPGIRTILDGRSVRELPASALPRTQAARLHALRHGPNAGMLNDASAAYYQTNQRDLGLAFLSQAVRFDMGYLHYRKVRVAYSDIDQSEWLVTDLEHLLKVYPGHSDYLYQLDQAKKEIARKAREERMPREELIALARLTWNCREFSGLPEDTRAETIASHPLRNCGAEAIARWPNEASAWLAQAEVLHRYRRPGFEEAARRYLALVQRDSPNDDRDIAKVKAWLGER